MDWVRLVLVLGLAGVGLLVIAAYLMARAMIRPPRMSDGKAAWVLKRLSPGDLSLAFEEVSFSVRDERSGESLRVAGWWIPNPNANGRCVILVHGYADAKVGAIAWAPTFHGLGWNILAYDLRAHGQSGGRFVTAGYYEQHDLNQVIDQLRLERPEQTRKLALFGASMGCAIVALVAAQRDDLCAAMLESPSGDEATAMTVQLEIMGMPGRVARALAYRFMRWMTGAAIDQVRPIDAIPRIRCPLMVIHPEFDVYVPPGESAAMEAALAARTVPTVYWKLADLTHLMALHADPEEYRRRMAEFLERYCAE